MLQQHMLCATKATRAKSPPACCSELVTLIEHSFRGTVAEWAHMLEEFQPIPDAVKQMMEGYWLEECMNRLHRKFLGGHQLLGWFTIRMGSFVP